MLLDAEQLFKTWVQSYSHRLVGLAYTYVKDMATAEDRVQDALIKAYRSMDQLNNVENPYPWLVRIVINECRTAQRKGLREVVTSILPERIGVSTEEIYIRSTESREVYRAVLALPEKYRTPIVLFYFDDLSAQEIADILKTNAGTIRTRLARGREQLRKMLREDEISEPGRKTSECKTFS